MADMDRIRIERRDCLNGQSRFFVPAGFTQEEKQMSEAAYLTGIDSIDEQSTSEALNQFVTNVLSTTNVMWAASSFSEIDMSEDIGQVANNLYNEALYLRRRLDRETTKRLEEYKKEHPERFRDEADED